MLFNSTEFLIFFPIVVLIYFWTPFRFRWIWLLFASYAFYMAWKAEYALLIVASTIIDYCIGLGLGSVTGQRIKRSLLAISLVSNLGLLFAFKYLNFFAESTRDLLNQFNIVAHIPAIDLLLPVGISFYTFQTLGYTIDLYRGERQPERHLGIFALYVSFFPQLVAGPIERSSRLLPQFYKQHNFDYARVVSGLRQMAWGFFKKLVIADKAAIFVDAVYGSPHDFSGLPLILATYLFAFQIYCDFSGYSDIAIGAARVLGIDLMENFRQPYLSRSVAEFWRRWHISLSTWFRDYLYIPLGGSRVVKWRWFVNLMIVFAVSGLWHGASWTFVIWGILHGLYLIGAILLTPLLVRLVKPLRKRKAGFVVDGLAVFTTFHLVAFAWIFFRASSVDDAVYIVTHLFSGLELQVGGFGTGLGVATTGLLVLSILFLETAEYVRSRRWFNLAKQPVMVRWSAYYVVIAAIALLGEFQSQAQFIYFQF